uniref:Uncharacterized protein n=1 Tax=Rhizophora mucronata TaxID=61149 RepID=A0A2P2PK83_RHIMU
MNKIMSLQVNKIHPNFFHNKRIRQINIGKTSQINTPKIAALLRT